RNPRRDMLLLMLSSSRSRCSPRKGDREAGGAAPFVRRAADRVPYPHVEREARAGAVELDEPAAVQVVRPPERRARHDPDHLTPRAILASDGRKQGAQLYGQRQRGAMLLE